MEVHSLPSDQQDNVITIQNPYKSKEDQGGRLNFQKIEMNR